jgi:hypothetical protein
LEYRRYDNRTPDARRAARADPWCFAAIHRRVQTPVDDIVTDPRLRRDELLRWIETRRRDEYYAGRHGPESCRRWSG